MPTASLSTWALFWARNFLLWRLGATVLCTVGCLATFLASTHQWMASFTQLRVNKNVSIFANIPWGAKSPLAENQQPTAWGCNSKEQAWFEIRNGIWHMASVLGEKVSMAEALGNERAPDLSKRSIFYSLWLILSFFFISLRVQCLQLDCSKSLVHDTLSLFAYVVLH